MCDSQDLESVLFVGYIPPVNQMRPVGQRPREQPAYPAELLFCPHCKLVQLGCIVDPAVLFPPDYPYTSGTTRILHQNFVEMVEDCKTQVIDPGSSGLVVDIGSNDGTLLSKWKQAGHRVHGIEPTDKAQLAVQAGIPSTQAFFTAESAAQVRAACGPAKVITATNVFAHIENIHAIVEAILLLLDRDGVFISESHYLMSLLETCQYDTIYHEHLRYYSVHSLQYLLNAHGLDLIRVKRIPSHGGSVRVYAAHHGTRPVQPSVAEFLAEEQHSGVATSEALHTFAKRVVLSKLKLYALLKEIKEAGERIYGIGASFEGQHADRLYGPGRRHPRLRAGDLGVAQDRPLHARHADPGPRGVAVVLRTARLRPAALLAHREELMPKLRKKGFRGKFLIPLPEPRIVAE